MGHATPGVAPFFLRFNLYKMKFSSTKVITLPVIADINSVAVNTPAQDTEFDLAADCDGGPFTDVIIGVLIVNGPSLDFYTYDEYLAGVKAQTIDPLATKYIGAAITCPNYWALLAMNVAEFIAAMGVCCNGFSIASAAYALKTTAGDLTPGEQYPCGTLAGFKWLAVLGSEDPAPNFTRFFEIELKNASESLTLVGVLSTGPLAGTVQTVLNWPEDFIGLTIDGTTILANEATPGPGEVNVGEFDFGTITVRTRLVDGPTELIDEQEWALPDTTCEDAGSSSAGSSGSLSISDSGGESSEAPPEFPMTPMALWIDMTDPEAVDSTGDVVVTAFDKSGNERHMTNATPGTRPAFVSSGGPNNYPYMDLTGGKTLANLDLPLTHPYSFFIVMKLDALAQTALIALSQDAGNDFRGFYILGTTFGVGNASFPATVLDSQKTTWMLVNVKWNGSASSQMSINNMPWFRIGANLSPTNQITLKSQSAANLKIAEIIAYDADLTDSEIQDVIDVLFTKYAPVSPERYIAWFGDSKTAGNGGASIKYADIVSTDKVYSNYNFAAGGTGVLSNTNAADPDFIEVYGRVIRKQKTASYIVMNYGTNTEFLPRDSVWRDAYRNIIQEFITDGWDPGQIILIAPCNQNAIAFDVRDFCQSIATELGIQFLDSLQLILDNGGFGVNMADVLHENNAGVTLIADALKLLIAD